MSVYNYNQFNQIGNNVGNQPYNSDRAAPSNPTGIVNDPYATINEDFTLAYGSFSLAEKNRNALRESSINNITERARERVEIDPFRAISARGAEIRNVYRDNMGEENINPLDQVNRLITDYYSPKLNASVDTRALIWKQENMSLNALTTWIQDVGSIKPNNYINPAVVEQYRRAIEKNETVSPFILGGQYSGQVRDDLKIFNLELAAAVQKLVDQQGTTKTQQDLARYYSRPGIKEYTDLFTSGGNVGSGVKGVFFQFQNTNIISNLMAKGTSFSFLTQRLDQKAFDDDNSNRLSILIGNELSIGVTQARQGRTTNNQNVYGIESSASFHPKLGYIPFKGTDGLEFRLAFITTQNITPALSSNKTVESLLVLNSGSTIVTERTASQEIISYTDYLLNTASGKRSSKDVLNDKYLYFNEANVGKRKYLRLQGGQGNLAEVQDTYYRLINTAAESSTDKVVIAMDQFTSAGFLGEHGLSTLENLLKLADQKRLVVTLSRKTIEDARKAKDQRNFKLYAKLADRGALRIVPMQKVHEKSISVFDGSNNLVAWSVGSGNISKSALSGEDNVEANLYFGLNMKGGSNYNFYGTGNDAGDAEYLGIIQHGAKGKGSEFMGHMSFLTGGRWGLSGRDDSGQLVNKSTSDYLYKAGYKAEMPSPYISEEKTRIMQIKQFETEILKHNVSKTTGIGKISVEYRYAPEARADYLGPETAPAGLDPVGLRVNITSPEGKHNVSLDMTVTAEGNVVISDLNKILGKSLWVNKTNEEQVLFKGASGLINEHKVGKGKSVKLNPFETALAFINTVQREFVYQSDYTQKEIYFDRLRTESLGDAVRISQDIIAQQFRDLDPRYHRMVREDKSIGTANLSTILTDLAKQDSDRRANLITEAFHRLASNKQALASNSLGEITPELRLILLNELQSKVEEATSRQMSDEDMYVASKEIGEEFISLLALDSRNDKHFSDIRSEFINKHDRLRQEYSMMSRTQSRAIVGELAAPFIASHETTYGNFQAESRMPVFGEETIFSHSYQNENIINFFKQGMLNPLAYGHATKLGEPGEFYRSLGSSATGEPLKLPHLGGLRQLAVVDSDLGSGAGIVHDYETLSGSLNTLQILTKDRLAKELKDVNWSGEALLDELFSSDEQGENIALMYSSFPKAESLTQRIKNLVGSRPAIEINPEYLSNAIGSIVNDAKFLGDFGLTAPSESTPGRVDDRPENIIGGRLRNAVSTSQLTRIKQVQQIIADSTPEYNGDVSKVTFQDVETYFKRHLVQDTNLKGGFIGPAEIRRVAIAPGNNLFSDPIYANAGYNLLRGQVRSFKGAKLNLEHLENPILTQDKIVKLFSKQGIITTSSWKDGEDIYKPGYYVRDDDNKIVQIAKYTDDGYLEFNELYKTKQTAFGLRREKLTFKSPAFATREEGGITIVRGMATETDTSRGVSGIQFEGVTVQNPSTGSRLASGDALVKGTLVMMQQGWFENKLDELLLNQVFKEEAQRDNLKRLLNVHGQANYKADTFLLMSPKNVKGFSIKGGVSMIASDINPDAQNKSSFVGLYEQDNLRVAQSLALMFLGDAEIAKALANTTSDPIKKMALLNTNGKIDLSTTSKFQRKEANVSNLLLTATGFLGLASSTPGQLELESLKETVLAALIDNNSAEANNLRANAQKLLLSARNSHISERQSGLAYGGYFDIKEVPDGPGKRRIQLKSLKPDELDEPGLNVIRQQVQLDDKDGIVRAAAIYAQLSLTSTQLFTDKHVAEVLAGTKFTTNELALDNIGLYHGFTLTREGGVVKVHKHKQNLEGYTRETYANYINMIDSKLGRGLQALDRYFSSGLKIKKGKEDELYAAYQSNLFILNALERDIGRGFPMYTLMDVSLSQSLVPAGMKDSVQFEYSSYLALTSDRLRAFREPLGLDDSTYATNVQHAHFMILSLLNRNIYSHSHEENLRRASFKLPFTGSGEEGKMTFKDGEYNAFYSPLELDLFAIASRTAKGVDSRTIRAALQDAIKLNEHLQGRSDKSNQIRNITDYFVDIAQHNTFVPKDRVAGIELKGVNTLLKAFAERASQGQSEDDYVSGLIGLETALIEEIANLTRVDSKGNKAKIAQLQRLRNSVYSSKNIIIPSLSYVQDPSVPGKTKVYLNPFSDTNSGAIGMFLGTDIFKKISMIFGDFKSEIVSTQMGLVNQFMLAQPVLEKVRLANTHNGVFLDDMEISIYNELISRANSAYMSIASLITSNVTRQAYGDHEAFKGSVGIPANTSLLNPWEMVVGDRALRLAGDSMNNSGGGGLAKPALGKVIDKYVFQALNESLGEKHSRHGFIADLVNTYTVRLGKKNKKTGERPLRKIKADNLKTYAADINNVEKAVENRSKLDTIYGKLYNDLTRLDAVIGTNEGELTINEKKLLLTAKIYSDILDLGDDTYDRILTELVADSLDFKRLNASGELPTSWADAVKGKFIFNNLEPQYTMDRLAQLSFAVISQRTGHPSGASGAINEQDNYTLMLASILETRRKAIGKKEVVSDEVGFYDGDQFVPALHRMTSGMIVPSISRFLSMLGDYDGDSHRILVSKTDKLLTELNKTQEKISQYEGYLNNFNSIDFQGLKTKERLIDRKQGQVLLGEFDKYFQDDEFVELIKERNLLTIEYKQFLARTKTIQKQLKHKQAKSNIETLKKLWVTDITDPNQIIGAFTKVYETLEQVLDKPLTEPSNDPRAPFRPVLKYNVVEQLEDIRPELDFIQNQSHKYFNDVYLPREQTPYLEQMESMFLEKKGRLIDKIPDSPFWQDDMYIYTGDDYSKYEQEYNKINNLTLDSINTDEYLRKNKLAGRNLSYSKQLEIVFEHKKQQLIKEHYITRPEHKYGHQINLQYYHDEFYLYDPELDRLNNLTIDDIYTLDNLPTFRKEFYFEAKKQTIKNEIKSLKEERQALRQNINYTFQDFKEYDAYLEQKIFMLENNLDYVNDESKNVALMRKLNLMEQVGKIIAPEIVKAEEDYAQRMQAIENELAPINELKSEIQGRLKDTKRAISGRLLDLLTKKGIITFDENTPLDSESFKKVLASNPDLAIHYLVNYGTRLAYSSSDNSKQNLQDFYSFLEESLNAKLPPEINQIILRSPQNPLAHLYGENAPSSLHSPFPFNHNADKSNYIKTLKGFIDNNLENIDVSVTYASVDRLTKFKKLRKLAGLLDTTINKDLDFRLESFVGEDRKAIDKNIINQNLTLIRTITGVGNALISENLRMAGAEYSLPNRPPSITSNSMWFPNLDIGDVNRQLYTGYNTSDNFNLLYQALINADDAPKDESGNYEVYLRHIENLRQIESEKIYTLADQSEYLIGFDDGYRFNEILDFGDAKTVQSKNAARFELNLQIGLFEQQKRVFDLAVEAQTLGTIDDWYSDNYDEYLNAERNRLIEQQRIIVDNFTRYIQAFTGSPDASLDEILDSVVDATESYSPTLIKLIEAKLNKARKNEEELMRQFVELQSSRRIVESRKTDDIHKFIKMYTGVPDFIYDNVGDQAGLNLGDATSLLRQKFSLDGLASLEENDQFLMMRSRSGLMTDVIDTLLLDDPWQDIAGLLQEFKNLDLSKSVGQKRITELYNALEARVASLAEGKPHQYALTKQSLKIANFGGITQDSSSLNPDVYGFGLELKALADSLSTTGVDELNYAEAILSHYGMYSNFMTATGEMLSDPLKKAAGQTLDPFQFDAAIQALGKGGSELIGTAYNTLIPLLNQTMFLAPFAVGTSGQENLFNEYIAKLELDKVANAAEIARIKEVAKTLGVNLDGSDMSKQKQFLEKKFYNTVGVVASFQQIVRDALKPPGKGKNIVSLFDQKSFQLPIFTQDGDQTTQIASLSDILAWSDPRISVQQQEKLRNESLTKFLGLLLGTDLSIELTGDTEDFKTIRTADLADSSKLSAEGRAWLQTVEGQDWAQSLTGFGGLMLLSDFAKTEEGTFYSKFVESETGMYGYMKQDFDRWLQKRGGDIEAVEREGFAREYVKARIVDLMQRTQSGFAAESIKSASVHNATNIMERALYVKNKGGFEDEIAGYNKILSRYEQARIDSNYQVSSSGDKEALDYKFMKELLLRRVQLEHAQTQAFNPESIEYLRVVHQDLAKIKKAIDEKGQIDATDLTLLLSNNVNAVNDRLKRGKITSMSEALTYGQFNIGVLTDLGRKSGFSEAELMQMAGKESMQLDSEQLTVNMLLAGLTRSLGLNPEQATSFLRMMMARDNNGEMGIDKFAKDASFASQIVNIKNEVGTSQVRDDTWDATQAQANEVLNFIMGTDQVLPTDKLGQLYGDKGLTSFPEQMAELQRAYKAATTSEFIDTDVAKPKGLSMRANYAAEAIGIIGSPLLFALAGSNMQFDERIGSFAIDAIQGFAEISSQRGIAAQFLGTQDLGRQASIFSQARMRQAMSVEGLSIGAIQGVGQELMYKSISSITNQVVGGVFNHSIQQNPNIVNVGSSIAGELIGSVLAQGVTRALFKTRSYQATGPDYSAYSQSPITRLVSQYVEEIWKAAEDAQMEQLEAEYVVMDTDANQELDIDANANPGTAWFDIESGILILDESGQAVETEFQDDLGQFDVVGNIGRSFW